MLLIFPLWCHASGPPQVVTQRFAQFGDLEYVKVLTLPRTGEGRGIAYVKYSKTSTAMRAMEDITEQEQLSPTCVLAQSLVSEVDWTKDCIVDRGLLQVHVTES